MLVTYCYCKSYVRTAQKHLSGCDYLLGGGHALALDVTARLEQHHRTDHQNCEFGEANLKWHIKFMP